MARALGHSPLDTPTLRGSSVSSGSGRLGRAISGSTGQGAISARRASSIATGRSSSIQSDDSIRARGARRGRYHFGREPEMGHRAACPGLGSLSALGAAGPLDSAPCMGERLGGAGASVRGRSPRSTGSASPTRVGSIRDVPHRAPSSWGGRGGLDRRSPAAGRLLVDRLALGRPRPRQASPIRLDSGRGRVSARPVASGPAGSVRGEARG